LSENESGEKRLKTNHVQPDLQAVSDRTTNGDKVVGFASDSFNDSYSGLDRPNKGTRAGKELEESEKGTI